jgi:DNA-binding NtrC family response regulator
MALESLLELPSDADLRRLIHFSSSDGRIWLAGQRMLLVHAAALANVRSEFMRTVGLEYTRRVFMRAGYASGERDAILARQVRPNHSLFEAFSVGPQLHMLEGAVQVTPELFELDLDQGHYLGKYRWDHSWEAEAHLRDFGPQASPTCWMLLGYASGYTSGFFGRPMLYKELACRGCGASHCSIEGRFQEEWPDGQAMADDYTAASMLTRLGDLRLQVEALQTKIETADEGGPLVGKSAAFTNAFELLRKAAPTKVSVLLTGETGVGKERFARSLHAMSPRAKQPFIAVNCAALPGDLIESELFGVDKGAFTGANEGRAGRFERANGGTLLLDELGDLPLPAQAKLLRVLQTGEVERLGSTHPVKIDVRVIGATNVDLEAAVLAGRFRRDLLYRLNVYPILIPPLRERPDDIDELAARLLAGFAAQHDKRIPGFTDQASDAMRSYPWPGNVRELENLIERGVILVGSGQMIDVAQLFPSMAFGNTSTVNARGALEKSSGDVLSSLLDTAQKHHLSLQEMEDGLVREAVRRADHNLAGAARILGLTRPQLAYRLQRLEAEEQKSSRLASASIEAKPPSH